MSSFEPPARFKMAIFSPDPIQAHTPLFCLVKFDQRSWYLAGSAATFKNAAKTKLESSLDVQTEFNWMSKLESSLDAQTEFQCGFEVSVINDSKLESSLDVRTNIQFGFQCDQCRQGTSSQYQYCYLDLVIWYYLSAQPIQYK